MTLARQLRVLLAALAALVFFMVWLAGTWSSRQLLEADLVDRTELAAREIVARIADHPAAAEALAQAVARTGLRSARLERVGEPPVERSASPAVAAVPGWFAVLFPLAVTETLVAQGEGVRLVVRAETAEAMERLWAAAVQAAAPAAWAALAVLLLGLLAVGPLVRPLRQAETEAATALDWASGADPSSPGGATAHPVQAAVRELSARAALLLDGAQGLAMTLHARASRDPLTGLASRRRLLDVLEGRRRDPEQAWSGGLLILHVDGVKGINETFGYAAGDDVLRECAHLLEEAFGAEPGAVIAHLAGGEFGVFLPCAGSRVLADRVAEAERVLGDLESRLRFPSSLSICVGSAYFHGQEISALFAEADRSLRKAQWQGLPGPALPPSADPDQLGFAARRAAGIAALEAGGLRLVVQPVLARETRELRLHEAYARVRAADGSEPLTIGDLIGAAQPGFLAAVDRAVLAEAVRLLEGKAVTGGLALNLSPATLRDATTGDWLEAACRAHPAALRRLVLEVPDVELPRMAERLQVLSDRLRPYGLRFAVDHFGAGPASFSELRDLRPRYLKIDGSFAARLDRDPEAQFFVRATAQIAHALGIPAYLEAVESEAVWRLLPDLQLDGGQGYHLGRPRDVG